MSPEHKSAARRWMIDHVESLDERRQLPAPFRLVDLWLAVYSTQATRADVLNTDPDALHAVAVDALSTVRERRAAQAR